MRFRIKLPDGTIEERDSIGPANDSAPEAQIEIRASELESAERADEWNTAASVDDFNGWIDNVEGIAPDKESQAGWLARQIHDVRKTHTMSDVGIDGWPRALIARLATTHRIDLRCSHGACAARARGPLPLGWFADAETGDVLCPIHAAKAVWLDVEVGDEIGSELSEPGLEHRILDALNGVDEGSPTIVDLNAALDVGGDS